jgi:hypothetical protein
MAFSTFSGPLRTGTQKDGLLRNTGLVTVAQSVAVPFSAMTTAPTAQSLFRLPAGTKILRINYEVVTAISGGSVSNVGVTLGLGGGSASFYQTSINTGLTVGKLAQATVDAAMVVTATNNTGLADVLVTGTFTAATGNPTAGSTVVTIEYIQRADDGTQNPASSL